MEEYSKIVDMIMNGGVFYGGGYEHNWRSVLGMMDIEYQWEGSVLGWWIINMKGRVFLKGDHEYEWRSVLGR